MPPRLTDFAAALLLFVLLLPSLALASAEPITVEEQTNARTEIQARLGTGNSYALVIGISEFGNSANPFGGLFNPWRALPGVPDEIPAISEAFAGHDFQVRTYAPGSVTKAELAREISRFVSTYGSDPRNRLVVYIASHGYRDVHDPDGIGYIITSDSVHPDDPRFRDTAYSVTELSRDLQAGIAAQHVYLFFNACFAGALMLDVVPDAAGTRAARPRVDALTDEVAAWTRTLLASNARMVLTAGNDLQEVPDRDNPFARAVVAGLAGAADADGDGLILGTELAQFVRGYVARETYRMGRPNDPVFAIIPKLTPPPVAHPDAPERIDYALQGDFVFLTPEPAMLARARARVSAADEVLESRRSRLPANQFTECIDCPVMVEVGEHPAPDGRSVVRLALARTETTYAEWDACFREFGCRRYIPDGGLGRGDRPVSGITWEDVLQFETWLTSKSGAQCERYRLPTREEWIAAARPAQSNPLTAAADTGRAVCRDCPGVDAPAAAARTASLRENDRGLHDMEGNLWEWVRGAEPSCGFRDLGDAPRCEADGTVIGGSFATASASLDLAMEGHPMPRTSNSRPFSLPTVGFRIACEMR